MYLHRILRIDWVEAEATWNIYKSGSSWSTAGCSSDGNDYTTTNVVTSTVPAGYGWKSVDITNLWNDAIDAGATSLNIRLAGPTWGSAYAFYVYGRAHASYKPYISYTELSTFKPKIIVMQ